MMFTQFKQKLVARLTKFAYLIVPCSAVIPVMSTEIPEGYLVINAQNVYEVEHKRLYDVLAKNNNLSKGSDSKGNYVKLPDSDGRCIELTSNLSFVGKLLAAALPNIRGAFGSGGGSGLFWTTDTTEAFWGEKGVATCDLPLAKTNDRFSRIHIDASRVSAIYKSTKLQPSALQLLACIRC